MTLIVASIDFGTTYSGWAFSFKHDFEKDPTKVQAKQWMGANIVSMKAPTCVLIKSDGKMLESFGYEAETNYAELALENNHKDHYFFKRFKMMLFHKKHLHHGTQIEDGTGKSLSAQVVFSLCIKHLKDDLEGVVRSRMTGDELRGNDVKWVLTVPAIWNDAAKQFMRESAEMAGIESKNLIIALEPESASLFCHYLPAERCDGKKNVLDPFQPGTKYLVLDAGGGTVDITVHEVLYFGGLRELHKASEGAWGGTKVDDEYLHFLNKITGNCGILDTFKEKHMEQFVDLLRDFEIKKREITPTASKKVNFRIPSSLTELLQRKTGNSIKEAIEKSIYNGKVSFLGDKLRVDADIALSLFDPALSSIVSHLESLFNKPSVSECKTIVMVGGFSESAVLQERVKESFPAMKIIVPNEAGLAVLKGAAIFGHDQSVITQRVLKYTYGQEITHDSNNYCLETHPKADRKIDDNGIMRCYGIFDIHARVGQAVKLGQEQPERIYFPVYADQTAVGSSVLISNKVDPEIMAEGERIGKWTMPILDTSLGRKREFGASFIFGGTETQVKVVDKATGRATIVRLNCLD